MNGSDTENQTWVLTHNGKAFDLVDLDSRNVDIEDIAFSLGKLCRYAGHTEPFFSVAEHSIVLSQLVSEPAQLHGLLHDSSEAYLVDLPTPVKRMFPAYKVLEGRVTRIIYEGLGIEFPSQEIRDEIKTADIRMHLTERKQLMVDPPRPWSRDHIDGPFEYPLPCWGPKAAGLVFLETFKELGEKHEEI